MPPPAAPSATVDAKTAAAGVAASAANAPAMARAEQAPKARTVDDYVTSIRRALADGRDDDARRSLIAMRAQLADADAQLPAELREWAARVPRALP